MCPTIHPNQSNQTPHTTLLAIFRKSIFIRVEHILRVTGSSTRWQQVYSIIICNCLYRVSFWWDGTDPSAPAPRTSCVLRLVPHAPKPQGRLLRLAPRAALRRTLRLPPNSHCAQPRSDLRAVVSSSMNEHMLQPFVSCILDILHMFHLDVEKVDPVLHMLQ
jgi:hypothetical protein